MMALSLIGYSFHKSAEQQKWALACETHHKPGHGVTHTLFESILEPRGFEVNVYPHNHKLGMEVLEGKTGPAEFKYKLAICYQAVTPHHIPAPLH